MFRFITPIILIAIAVAGFFTFTKPLYGEITSLKEQVASYNEALNNSKALENERDKLTKKYNSFDPDDLAKLEKLLPDNVDNIRLILEIEKIAAPYGMTLKDVKYDTETKDTAASPAKPVAGGMAIGSPGSAASTALRKDYGIWNLEFSTEGSYNNFINFTKDLEKNLRIVDISSIDFTSASGSSSTASGASPVSSDVYKYSFKIKTYWLKN